MRCFLISLKQLLHNTQLVTLIFLMQEYFDINKDGVITIRELGKALEDEKIFTQCVQSTHTAHPDAHLIITY